MIGDREFKAAEHRWQNCKGTWSEKELSNMVATKPDDEKALQNEPIREFVTLERQWMLKVAQRRREIQEQTRQRRHRLQIPRDEPKNGGSE